MRIIIAGGSNFAVEVAKNLLKRGINDITLVIEDKEDALKASAEVPDITVVNASPIKPDALNELNLEKCDVFVSVSRREEINILAALYAKEHNVKRIYVKTTKEETKPILRNMGMIPIDIDESASNNIVIDIAEPVISDLISVGMGGGDIREKEVNNYSNLIGKRLGDIEGKLFNVIAVYQDGKFQVSANTIIKENSSLVILEESGQDEKVVKELKKI